MDQYINENMLSVTVYLKDPYIQVIQRSEKMSFITFLSNVGGIMGLCLGFSVLSAVEVIYFILSWLTKRMKHAIQTNPIIDVQP